MSEILLNWTAELKIHCSFSNFHTSYPTAPYFVKNSVCSSLTAFLFELFKYSKKRSSPNFVSNIKRV